MANRGLIVAIALVIGVAMLFSGFNGGTGAYVNNANEINRECHDAYESCMSNAAHSYGQCMGGNTNFNACVRAFNDAKDDCNNDHNTCTRRKEGYRYYQ
jgi:hypothetical protein